ncbi:neuronal acetylcholine receptor subunit alpha-3-like [Ruditapes philippinarum]|uniref:neuronal acetylcholine receptor subunit alpha-3-like n=1 Tax=Ruditapes philippinarum TaxID=129788 RepID=UPI00295BAA47|nr:neuronal acetylcholine receptor subunit alpha-3-like [Ruditapes philippinarum]
MEKQLVILLIFGINSLIQTTQCSSWTEVKAEYEKLYNAYSMNQFESYVNTIPSNDFTQPLDIRLEFEMNSLAEYDAVNGALDVIGSLSMTWTDSIGALGSVTFDTGKINEVMVHYKTVWTPVIVLINSADSIQRVGDETYKVRLNLGTGEANWKPRIIIKGSCSPDVTYFPFDQQSCTFTFQPWYLTKTRLKLSVASNEWKMDRYDKSGVWDIESTDSSTYISGDYYFANFTVTFNREPTYFTVNLVLPILCLSMLSGCVFLLPAASGERIGFVITCFLSFIVLLQTTMTYLPQASSPMSLLCYYVIVMMLFSAILTLITAILLRVYHKPKGEDVPRWLIHVLEIIKCIKCRRVCGKKANSVEDGSFFPGKSSKKGGSLNQMPKRTVFNADRLSSVTGYSSPKSLEQMKVKSVTSADSFASSSMASVADDVDNVKSASKSRSNREKVKVIASGLEVATESSEYYEEDDESTIEEIDWELIGHLLDTFFLLAFIGVQVGFSIIFLVPIGTRA